MFRWLFTNSSSSGSFDAASDVQSARDDRKTAGYGENYLFFDLVIAEIEMAVVSFEIDAEKRREEAKRIEKKPDYSWLIADKSARPKKYLTLQERNRVENACERLKPCEWAQTIDNWKLKIMNVSSRDDIIEQFILATHATIQSRKHEPTLTEVFKKYANGKSSSMSTVQQGEISASSTPRSVRQLSFIELHEIV